MTNEKLSYNTKKALADTLKELMTHKPFSKITVSEIIRECNVNRKTFYYHFEDIYSLLKWIFEQEAIDIVKKYDLVNDYSDVINFVFDYVEHNAFIISCAYDSLGRDVLKSFFYQDFISITKKIILSTERTLNIEVSNDFRNFLCNLYTEGIAGMLIQLAQHPEVYKKEQLIEYYSIIIHTSVPAVLLDYAKKANDKEAAL